MDKTYASVSLNYGVLGMKMNWCDGVLFRLTIYDELTDICCRKKVIKWHMLMDMVIGMVLNLVLFQKLTLYTCTLLLRKNMTVFLIFVRWADWVIGDCWCGSGVKKVNELGPFKGPLYLPIPRCRLHQTMRSYVRWVIQLQTQHTVKLKFILNHTGLQGIKEASCCHIICKNISAM